MLGWSEIDVRVGFDFADLTTEFFDNAAIYPAKQGRLMAVGEFRGETVIATIFVLLGTEALSVISMRRTSRKERKLYDEQ
ncbi:MULTISPECIES: hypothetical protein [unclassified Ochrobactrum]|uniref:hypothetical protein n=1 Tax=unclassified Ochrobactrum TaxID=239106 RepID=UPI000DEFF8AD|nr:hypothetical protein [Ochrobactrum sp. 3-3]